MVYGGRGMNNLGQRIKSIRLSFGENMREFGERFDASDSLVSRWEKHGVVPTPERLKAIAELSNQTVDELLDATDYKQLYEQQKQRADQAEKRWEKLKEHFIKEKEQSFGILSWSRNNGMLELIEKLEEDGE